MKLVVSTFLILYLIYIQVKLCEAAAQMYPTRMTIKLSDEVSKAPREVKRGDSKPIGWVWCSDKDENTTFAFKPCPRDPLEECLKDVNVSRANVLKLLNGDWWNTKESVRKWALCYLSKIGVMSSSGVLRQDMVLRHIPDRDKANVERTINKCLYKTRHDPVETAWNYLTCFRNKLPKYARIANGI